MPNPTCPSLLGRVALSVPLLFCLLGAAGCDSQTDLGQVVATLSEKPANSLFESLDDGDATRIYYQFLDDENRVRFVTELALVPEPWRDRMGYVEMSTPPPTSRLDMERTRRAQAERRAERQGSGQRGPEIVLYSANWCPACRAAKAYMDSKGIAYRERNVDEAKNAERLVQVSGGRSIPVFDIDGSIMKGFNPQRLDRMIAAAS